MDKLINSPYIFFNRTEWEHLRMATPLPLSEDDLRGISVELKKMQTYRKKYNEKLMEMDNFFKEFASLDDKVYADGAIDKKHKELMGLAISVLSRCNECICYHIEGCINANASFDEIIAAITIGVVGGGSITYPNARFAIKILTDLGLEK